MYLYPSDFGQKTSSHIRSSSIIQCTTFARNDIF